ncbi:MAG: hypothetical protein R6V83_02015 [Candidatus Thorarchaeota archaeon]
MGLTRVFAKRGLIPSGQKVSELRDNLARLMVESAVVFHDRFGSEGLDALSEVFRKLGEEDAMQLKDRLGLGETLVDAVDAWRVVGHVMGAKMKVVKVSETRVNTEHPYCPQYEKFKERGMLYCESVCLPYVRAIAEGVTPSVEMEVLEPANEERTCVKSLVISGAPE